MTPLRPHLDARLLARVLATLALVMFAGEFGIMVALEALPGVVGPWRALLDATVLATLSSAVVLWVVVRPLKAHILAQVDQLDALARHQEWLGRVFDSVDESIVVTDARGVVEHVNPAFTRRMGWTSDELRGKPTSQLKSGLHQPAQYEEMWRSLTTTGGWQGRVVDRTRGGELLELLMTVTPLRDAQGAIRGYVALHRDLTELQAHERALQHALTRLGAARDEAEETSAAKSRFLSTMSHEIRTPLAGILGTLELLDGGPLAPSQREYSGLALRSARALLALLNDVLDFSKLEARGATLTAEPFDAAEVVRDVRDLFLAQGRHKGVALTAEGAEQPVWVQGDEVRFRQVLSNLVGNAVKFTPAGQVTVRLVARDDGTMTRLGVAVEDTGIGIPRDQLASLFQPFRQVDPSATRRFGGTGLGLAISRHLVDAMGGTLGVTSEQGRGSTFRVDVALPRAARVSPSGSQALTDAERASVAGLRVLVADDNPVNQLVMSRLLQKLGCVVSLADDGAAALRRATEQHFDAVLMDLQMPVMDGLTAARTLRALPGGRGAVPIVALTANTFAEDRDACLAAGMNDFLCKPVQESQLVRTLLALRPMVARAG